MPASTTPASGSVPVALPPVWHYARQIVTGTGDVRIKFNQADPVTNAVIVSGVSTLMEDSQDVVNASARNLINNIGLATCRIYHTCQYASS